MKAFMMAATVVAGIAANAANAAPLPEAKPDDAGFSQQGLARLDDFFAREIAAKRVPGAVVAIARDGKLVQYKGSGQRHGDAAGCRVRACLHDQADGRGRGPDTHGTGPPGPSGKACRLLSRV